MARFNTQLVHGEPVNDNDTRAVNPPIYKSSTFAFESVDAMPRWDYARSGNPTREYLERQIAQLEHSTRGFAFASGLAAIHAVLSIFQPGDRIVAGDNVYGGSYSQLNEHFNRWGLEVTSADTRVLEDVERAVAGDPKRGIQPAKAVYFETVTNPLLKVNDVHAIAEIAHRYGTIVIVDNTFVTPYLQNPLDLGADIVLHSATKYLAGHSDVIAGLVVVKDEQIGQRVYFAQNRLGGVLAPVECDSVRKGIQTLALRLERQQENAADVLNNLRLFRLAVSLGAVESLAELPCRMTHFELPREERLKVGITDELIRLAIGIEDVADLKEDLGQAFEKASEKHSDKWNDAITEDALA